MTSRAPGGSQSREKPMRIIGQFPYRLTRRNRWKLFRYRYRSLFRNVENIIDIAGGVINDIFLRRNAETQQDVHAEPIHIKDERNSAKRKQWCLYAAYSPKSVVTEMVLAQLRSYYEAGFSVVFVSMSASISELDRQRLSQVCSHLIHRRSFGRDFGAWAHAVRLLSDEMEAAEALLLTNDSNVGPVRALGPWINRCMEQEGVFGLTESIGGGSHLQSYFIVCNGRDVVNTMFSFLKNIRLSHSKWLMIQRGEIALTRFMRARGHFIGALVDYGSLEDIFINNPELWTELKVVFPWLFVGMKDINITEKNKLDVEYNRYLLRSRLFLAPLNPSHHFNAVLVKHFGFPFIKTELILKNPAMLPSAADWRHFVSDESPVAVETIEDHLSTLMSF